MNSTTSMTAADQTAYDFLGDKRIFVMGAQFMGALFDSLFAGIILCQLIRWVPQAKKDNRVVQVLVTFGSMAALTTTIFTWANYLMSFIYDFGRFADFISFEMLGWYSILDGFTVVPVQLFFAERAIRINNNSVLIGIVACLLIAGTFGSAVGFTIVTRHKDMIEPTDAIRIIGVVWPAVCTMTHVFLTTSIVSGLLRTRSGGDKAIKLINRILAVTLESQLPSTLFAIAAMTAIASNISGPMVPFIIIVHPKVFMVGCLAMVNLRHHWRLTGKIPSTYHSGASISVSLSGALSRGSDSGSEESSGPSTPKMGMTRVFDGPRQGEEKKAYGFGDEEMAGSMERLNALQFKPHGE